MKATHAVVDSVLDVIAQRPPIGESGRGAPRVDRLLTSQRVPGPRGGTRVLVLVDGWPLLAIRPSGEVVRLVPGPEAPAWANPPESICLHCVRPARPTTLAGLEAAIREGLHGAHRGGP